MTESTTTPEATPEAPEISRTQLWHRTRALIKTHEIMDGSGHLYLKKRGEKVTKEQVREVIDFVHAELAKQGISEAKAKTMNPLVTSLLHGITRRGPEPKPQQPQQPEPTQPKPTTKPEQTQRKQQRQEVRIVTVTVKKRNFHYPRDLPAGESK